MGPAGEFIIHIQMRITPLFPCVVLILVKLSFCKKNLYMELFTVMYIYRVCIKVSYLNSEPLPLHNVIALQTRNK